MSRRHAALFLVIAALAEVLPAKAQQRAIQLDEMFSGVEGTLDRYDVGGGFTVTSYAIDGAVAELEVSVEAASSAARQNLPPRTLSLIQYEDLPRRVDRIKRVGPIIEPAGMFSVALGQSV